MIPVPEPRHLNSMAVAAHATRALQDRRVRGGPAAPYSESYWRSLHLFNFFRLLIGLVLLGSVMLTGNLLQLGSHDRTLFIQVTVTYLLFCLVCVAVIRTRRHFNWQIGMQVVADIIFVTILIYASRGLTSGLGLASSG